jgi:hypothetical protein
MTIKQISLFMENKPGRLAAACKILRDAKINIVTLSLADTQQFGIVRLIVEDWERAKDALEKAHFAVNVHDVIAASVRDEPGGMAELLDIVEAAGVNIEYMYAFAARHGEEAILVFRFDDLDKAEKALTAAGRDVISPLELFSHK